MALGRERLHGTRLETVEFRHVFQEPAAHGDKLRAATRAGRVLQAARHVAGGIVYQVIEHHALPGEHRLRRIARQEARTEAAAA